MRVSILSKYTVLTLFLTTAFCISVNAEECYKSSITSPTPFMGNNDEIFKLTDGSLWQVKYEYEYLYEYYPSVTICPDLGKLLVDGKSLQVVRLKAASSAKPSAPSEKSEGSTGTVIESRIEGDSEGWEGETIVKLINGQIWQQVEYYYKYKYKYRPEVLIFKTAGGYKMQIEGIERAVGVQRLK